jgi:hypothetical protein
MAVAVGYYGGQVRAAVPADARAAPRRARWLRRALAPVAALALVAPVLVRNRGHLLPPAGTVVGIPGLTALALAGWVVMPVALVAAHAHDHHGPLPWRAVLGALFRHPLATLSALLVLLVALIAAEGLAAFAAWQQGQLPLLVVDLFPPPGFAYLEDGKHLYFDYDGTLIDRNYSASIDALAAVYPQGLRHGFTLAGTIPPSLSLGLMQVRTDPWEYRVYPEVYLVLRIVLTVGILFTSGIALAVQARWLGVIAAQGARRARSSGS